MCNQTLLRNANTFCPTPPLWANGVFSNAVPLGAQLKAPHVFRASCAALKARTCLRCFETGPQSTLISAVL